jgi:hypothetical protein
VLLPLLGRFERCLFRGITAAQAARLFSLDTSRCRRVLEALVNQGELWVEQGLFQVKGRDGVMRE